MSFPRQSHIEIVKSCCCHAHGLPTVGFGYNWNNEVICKSDDRKPLPVHSKIQLRENEIRR